MKISNVLYQYRKNFITKEIHNFQKFESFKISHTFPLTGRYGAAVKQFMIMHQSSVSYKYSLTKIVG